MIGGRNGHADVEIPGVGIAGDCGLPVTTIVFDLAFALDQVRHRERHTHFFV